MLLTMAPTVAFAADGDDGAAHQNNSVLKGSCGAEGNEGSVKWALTDDDGDGSYTLTISGDGAMVDFTSPTAPNAENANIAPWYTALTADETTNLVPITEIKIDEGVTYLGNYAFSYLTNVVKVNIPASITSLGDSIFRGDTALTTVEWASDFKAPEITDTDSKDNIYRGNYVPTSMFDGCTSLGSGEELSAWLPDSFTGVGCAAFRKTQFTVDFDNWSNLNYIGAYGFAGMPNLESFTLSAKITLGLRGGASNAFNSSGLKSLTVADGIAAIPSGLCNGCEQLSSVALADSVTTIAMNAFFNTKALEKIDLKNVQTINSYAFWGSGLTDLVLPKSVKKVESRAFEACTSLTKVTINAAELTLENKNTFAGCSALSTVVTSATSTINELNNGAFGPDTTYGSKDYKQAPVESIEIDGTVKTLNFSTLSSLKSLTINGKNTWSGNVLPSGFENLVINGDNWNISGYQFAGKTPIKHLIVSTDEFATSTDKQAAFRSNPNLETAQFTGKTVKLQDKMFLGCTKLNWLDLSAVDTLTVGSGCFGDDTSENYEVVKGEPNKFNEDCVIYAKDATAAQVLRTNLGTKGIVLVVNGGTVDSSKTGLAAVSRAGYSVTWTSSNGTAVTNPETTTLKSGETYTAAWTLATGNVEITYNPNTSDANDKNVVRVAVKNSDTDVARELFSRTGYTFTGWNTKADGTGTAYNTGDTIKADTMTLYAQWTLDKPTISGTATAVYGGKVTLAANTAASVASYQWYKDGAKIDGATNNSLTLTNVADSGAYTVEITVGTDTATSDPTTVTINKATPTIAISATPDILTGGGSVELTVSGVPTKSKLAVTCDNDITVTEKDGKYTAQLPNATKNYTFTAKYTGTDNYNDVEKTCVVKVTRKSSHSSSSGSSTTPTNTVSASTASNGKVALNKNTAKKGDTVTVTVTPDAGYQLDKLTITDAKGKTVDVTKKSDGKYTFTMPDSKVTITPTFSKIEDTKPSKNGFDDVASSDWFADAVKYVSDKGLMNGTDDNQFSPSASTTRGMLMTVLARYAGEDTTGGATWYEKGMNWAKAKGVSDGTNPNANITREQLVTMMYRYAGSPKADGKLDSFSDAASVSTYAADAMQWAVANGIVNGSNGKLNPQNNATRAQVAAILMRFCEMGK